MMRKMRTLSGILLGGFNRGCICNLAGADECLMDMRETVMFVWSNITFCLWHSLWPGGHLNGRLDLSDWVTGLDVPPGVQYPSPCEGFAAPV